MSARSGRRPVLLPLALALAGLSCADAAGPDERTVRLHLVPSFAAVETGMAEDQPALLVDNIRLEVRASERSALLDTVIAWPVDQDTLRIEVAFEAPPAIERFRYVLEARIGDAAIFSGEGTFSSGAVVLDPVLVYVGPGARAASILIQEPPALVAGDTIRTSAVVRDAEGGLLEDVAVVWSSLDAAAATVDGAGLITGGLRLDLDARIVARVPFTSIADTMTGRVVPASVLATPGADTMNALGDTVALAAAAFGADGSPASGAVFDWAMGPESPGALTDVGPGLAMLVGLRTGLARIAVSVAGVVDTAEVLVRQVPAALELQPADTLLMAGDTLLLTATAADSNGFAIADAAIIWSSSDPTSAAVDAAGTVTGALAGLAEITATHGPLSAAAAIEVVPGPAALLRASPETLSFTALGDTLDVSAVVTDSFGNAVATPITWVAADPTVATVDVSGRVAAEGPGATAVVASAADAGVTDTVAVEIAQVAAAVTITADSAVLAAGDSLQLTAAVTDANGFPILAASPSWASSDATIAAVDGNGVVTGALAGLAIISTQVDGAADSLEVEVVPGSATLLTTSPATLEFAALDDSALVTATATDPFGNVVPALVSWSVAGTGVVTVTDGTVTAVGTGTDTVIAQTTDLRATTTVTVTQVLTSVVTSPSGAIQAPVGEEIPVSAEWLDANGNLIPNVQFTWSVVGDGAADMLGQGLFFTVSPGTADLIAQADGVTGRLALDVTGLFIAAVGADAEGLPGIQLLRADDSGGPELLDSVPVMADGIGSHSWPAFSPDGSQLAYVRDGRVWIQDVDLINPPFELILRDQVPHDHPEWSPDGTRIAMVRDGKVAIVHMIDDTVITPTLDWPIDVLLNSTESHPTWSPEGDQIALVAADGETGVRGLWTLDLDQQAARQVDLAGLQPDAPAWSPTASAIAFSAAELDGPPSIWIVDPSAPDPFVISRPPTLNDRDLNPTWSPSGSRIAFERCLIDGCGEIWVVWPDGKDEHIALELPLAPDRQPAWGRPRPPR